MVIFLLYEKSYMSRLEFELIMITIRDGCSNQLDYVTCLWRKILSENISGTHGNAPKILWTPCPNEDCNKCLDVRFDSGNDTACLNQKWPNNNCVFEGAFLGSKSRVAVSSEDCLTSGSSEMPKKE